MEKLPVIILHGYSGESEHFEDLAGFLKGQDYNVVDIWLCDYISMTDEITINDLGQAMGNALQANNISQERHSFDVIVHSTGGLVIRQYLIHHFLNKPEKCPIRNLIMLAPAHFGSPLATMGKSMLGRLKNGWDWNTLWQTGTRVLNALEPASPISWKMAELDLFNPDHKIFTPEHIFSTILVGTDNYSGLAGLLHKNGSDGTVFVSTANLNAEYYKLIFNIDKGTGVSIEKRAPSYDPIAFGVLYDHDHGTITKPADDPEQLGALIIASLNIKNTNDYNSHLNRLKKITEGTFKKGVGTRGKKDMYHQYQHVATRVYDQFGEGVKDYFIEFFQEEGDDSDVIMRRVQGDILESVKINSIDKSYRSFLFDIDDMKKIIIDKNKELDMSLCASAISERIRYYDPEEYISVASRDKQILMKPNTSLFVDIELPRIQDEEVFKLKKA